MATENITLYELCDRVCDSIETAPMNYYQSSWAADAKLHVDNNACGTAFCRAGWMLANILPPKSNMAWKSLINKIAYKPESLLIGAGIPELAIHLLFNGKACAGLKAGTKEYVERGITGMRQFMTKYEDKLKAASVDVWVRDTDGGEIG